MFTDAMYLFSKYTTSNSSAQENNNDGHFKMRENKNVFKISTCDILSGSLGNFLSISIVIALR